MKQKQKQKIQKQKIKKQKIKKQKIQKQKQQKISYPTPPSIYNEIYSKLVAPKNFSLKKVIK